MQIPQVLSEQHWRTRSEKHRRRVELWTGPRLQRRSEGRRDPVDDFLWEYYRLSPAQLAVWHPGFGVVLSGDPPWAGVAPYIPCSHGWTAVLSPHDPLASRLTRNLALLRATSGRPIRSGCFGMHEWAMVHGLAHSQVRHAEVALRLTPDRIRSVVAEVGLQCTHFDAYRFFTETAAPLQRSLTRAGQIDDEQPGCVHAGMDLYRYAYEAAPYVGSDLVADCFEHARRARELDMRASPYDLSARGLEPIPIETPSGRRDYAHQQRELASGAADLRTRLIEILTRTVARSAMRCPEAAQSA